MKKERGITLIALVITIIVLLILAGVTISMVVGDNGILSKADRSKTKTERAKIVELARIDVGGQQGENLGSKLRKSELIDILNKYFTNVSEIENSSNILEETVTSKEEYGVYDIKVKEIYNNGFLDDETMKPEMIPTSYDVRIRYCDEDGITILEETVDRAEGFVGEEINISELVRLHPEWCKFNDFQEFEYVENDSNEKFILKNNSDENVISLRYVIQRDITKISCSITPSQSYPIVGEEFYYIIEVENRNRVPINVMVYDALPDSLDFSRIIETDGGVYNADSNTILWNSINVQANSSKKIQLYVKANAKGDIRNEAQLKCDLGTCSGNTRVTAK